jgi:hypothetical protein
MVVQLPQSPVCVIIQKLGDGGTQSAAGYVKLADLKIKNNIKINILNATSRQISGSAYATCPEDRAVHDLP